MKLKTLIAAIKPLQKLSQADLPLQVAYELNSLINDLQTDVDFYSNHIQQLLEKNPRLNVESTEYAELINIEISNRNKVTIPLISDIKLSVNDLTALKQFINFCAEE